MKCIDSEKLMAEIEKRMKKRDDGRTIADMYSPELDLWIRDKEDDEILSIIDSLQQDQSDVGLAKFTERIDYFTERYKNNLERMSIKGAMTFMARMFYQYPNVAREWYENLPKAIMN